MFPQESNWRTSSDLRRPLGTQFPSEDLDSVEREPKAKRGKGSKRVAKKTKKSKPVVKQRVTAMSTTPSVSATPARTVAVSVSVESTVSIVAKKSRRTTGAQQTGDVKINTEDLRRACVGAMMQMLCEGYQFARHVDYD